MNTGGHRGKNHLPSIDSKIRTGDITTGIAQQVHDRALQVFGRAHFADGDQRRPGLVEFRVVVEDLAGQRRQHVPGGDAVDADVGVRPFDGQTGGEVADGGLGRVVWRLGLRHVDDGAGHAADHDDAAVGDAASLHQVAGHACREEVCPVDIDAPEFLDPVVRVRLGGEVLGEARRRDEVVDLAVLGDDLVDAVRYTVRVRDVGIVGRHLGRLLVWEVLCEQPNDLGGLLFAFLLCVSRRDFVSASVQDE